MKMVTDFEYQEKIDMFTGRVQEIVRTRETLVNQVYEANDNKLTSLPMTLEQLREYQAGTVLIRQMFQTFVDVFEVEK